MPSSPLVQYYKKMKLEQQEHKRPAIGATPSKDEHNDVRRIVTRATTKRHRHSVNNIYQGVGHRSKAFKRLAIEQTSEKKR